MRTLDFSSWRTSVFVSLTLVFIWNNILLFLCEMKCTPFDKMNKIENEILHWNLSKAFVKDYLHFQANIQKGILIQGFTLHFIHQSLFCLFWSIFYRAQLVLSNNVAMYNEVMINIFIYLSYSTLISINLVEKAKELVINVYLYLRLQWQVKSQGSYQITSST